MPAHIDDLTSAGQRYTMAKITSLMDGRLNRADLVSGPCNRTAATELLHGLTQESERLAPNVQAFATRAETLLDLLVS
jgi:hypothetical protein